MLDIAVARKYAKALFEVSLREGNADRISSDLHSLLELRDSDPSFMAFLVSPEVATDPKHEFIGAVFEPRLDPMVIGFLRLLVDKGRIVNLPSICEVFQILSEEHRGLVRAQVISVTPISASQETKLKQELGRLSGKEVILESKLDPSILGGIIVHLGDKIIDRSVRGGLKSLNHHLMEQSTATN
ncbi:MAG: ATP synthase F1 subunit delta [Candidatus Eisenbacteria bacterium]|uniref:ATP synthase subunit delta n=1 Tax=Eiseniibacteriota bacterium TaxID=2212470 RepID=A0A7Y2ECN0_UNCEI|nr:ATP synthase F1 subunit delta [Candidatus Eisenbacteria bacterium]